MKTLRCFALCGLLALAAGCAQPSPPQQVDMAQYMFETALSTCQQRTNDLMHDSPELCRRSYFEQCMDSHGYSRETYKHLWINI